MYSIILRLSKDYMIKQIDVPSLLAMTLVRNSSFTSLKTNATAKKNTKINTNDEKMELLVR
jgi:hypothetical protein